MSPWPAVIIFTVLASCAVVVVVGYVRGNRRIRAAAASAQPERDEEQAQTDGWLWG